MKKRMRRIIPLALALCLCLSLCTFPAGAVDESLMPVEGSYGPITLTLRLTKSGSDYTAAYTASTTMIDWLAQAAAVCKDDPRMANLRFTCTLKDALTATLATASSDDYTFISAKYNGKDIFVLDGVDAVKVDSGALKLRYKLNPDVLSAWKLAATATVKGNLQEQMLMTASQTVPAATVAGLGSSITSTARIDITITAGKIPFYDAESIWAAYGTCTISNPENPVIPGPSGGGTTEPEEKTVEVVDSTPSTVDPETGEPTPSDIPTGGGKTTVENPDAKPGEDVRIITESDPGSMVNYISVKDESGNRIPIVYEGEGKFSFEMPEEGKVTVDATYRVIPADPVETGVAELLNTDDHTLYMIGDDKGLFRPNASISRAEVATAFFRLLRNQDVPITEHFDDVASTAWYVQPIETLASLNILEGIGDDIFEPNRPITRAEFAAVAARFANTLTEGTSFKDVDEDAWYAIFVSTAAHFGWINGVGNGMYEPNRPITRTEAAAIINRMLFRISDWIYIDAGHGRHFPDVSEDFWGRYEIGEATNDHDHTSEEEYFHEDWIDESWHDTVDNDPVNFGQPTY